MKVTSSNFEKVKQDDRDPGDRNGLDLFFYIPTGSLGTEKKHMYIQTYVYIHVHVHTYMHMCVHVYMNIYI